MPLISITEAEALEYLASQRVDMPAFMVTAAVGVANGLLPCFTVNGYTQAQVYMIQAYIIAITGLSQLVGNITSEGAPSGASRSFAAAGYADRMRGLRALLYAADPKGCANGVIPTDTSITAHGGLWLGTP